MPFDPFHLADDLRAKAAPELIADDREHLRRIAEALELQRADVISRLTQARRREADLGHAVVDRDLEIRRLSGRLRVLERFGLDICLGRMTLDDGEHRYIGRTGLADADGFRLLVDWRTPAAEPYFAATLEHPRGVISRRRYRWTDGRIRDYWDEALSDAAFDGAASLDDQSAFIASLGTHRTARMRDVLATIQADQDAIIRTSSRGALVVDGGPGTGKTVVALHRAAQLLYAEPRLTQSAGGMLLIGPHAHYLAYVEDVLPSLGEDTVRLATIRDLVPEGASASDERSAEHDARVARLKGTLDPVSLLDAAARWFERPPHHAMRLESPWADLWLSRDEWAELFSNADPAISHNEARDEVWEEILELLTDQVDDEDAPPHMVRRWLRQDAEHRARAAAEDRDEREIEWRVPYLPIDPADIGRDYDAVIRVNSQSGKGGIAYLLESEYGVELPRRLQIDFARHVQRHTDATGAEVTAAELWDVFEAVYLRPVSGSDSGTRLVSYDSADGEGNPRTRITLQVEGREYTTVHREGGPIEALSAALSAHGVRVDIVGLHQTSVGAGAESDALTLLEHRTAAGSSWSAGRGRSVLSASLSAVMAAAVARSGS